MDCQRLKAALEVEGWSPLQRWRMIRLHNAYAALDNGVVGQGMALALATIDDHLPTVESFINRTRCPYCGGRGAPTGMVPWGLNGTSDDSVYAESFDQFGPCCAGGDASFAHHTRLGLAGRAKETA